jgi:hypothetical protein
MDIDQLKKDTIEQCRLEYQDNQVQLGYINDFNKNCTPDNVLNWYTKDLICKFRYFITLLYNKHHVIKKLLGKLYLVLNLELYS